MIKYIYLLTISVFFLSCNDGDLILTNFDFEDASLEDCGEAGGYVFFKINPDVNESISVFLNTTDELFTETGFREFSLSETGNMLQYRAFTEPISSDYFCNPIPPSTPTVTSEYIGSSGIVRLNSETVLDDNDGVDEEEDNTIDTDNDGIPNYYDFDDDGDNVNTITELGSDPENPRDTDGDGIPDYLDNDDDGDMVFTINEDLNEDLNPANDSTDGIPNYLNDEVTIETIVETYKQHSYNLTSDGGIIINNLVLVNPEETITIETLDLGESIGIRNEPVTITPDF